jgi:hypothetical protein
MGRNVATFVIGVDGEVHTHQLVEFLRVETKEVRVITRPVKVLVRGELFALMELIAINHSRDFRETSNEVERVLGKQEKTKKEKKGEGDGIVVQE